MRLFDKLERKGFLTEVIKEAGLIHKIDGTYASDLYFTQSSKEVWYFKDFPNCIPANKYTWIEFRAPKAVVSTVMGINPWNGPKQWGWLIKRTDVPAKIGFHYFQERNMQLDKANFALAFTISTGGQVSGDQIEFFAPSELIDTLVASKKQQEELLEEWIPMLHPALYVLCDLNGVAVNITDSAFHVVDGIGRTIQ